MMNNEYENTQYTPENPVQEQPRPQQETPRPQYYSTYNYGPNSYAQQGQYQQAQVDKKLNGLKKTMYKVVAVACVLALVIGVAGGGVVGYLLADRNDKTTTMEQQGGQPSPATTTAGEQNPFTQPSDGDKPAATTGVPSANVPTGEKPEFLIAPTDSEALPVQEVYASNVDSVVSIFVEITETYSGGYYYYGQQQTYTQESAGSGVIISEDGYIVTNNHVIENATKIRVCLQDGREFEARLIGTDADTDVAVIKIEADDLKVAVIGDSDQLSVGDQAIVIGNPLGKLSGTLTVGYVSALNRELLMDDVSGQTMAVIQTDAAVNPGNSGGALFNAKGELVGVVFAKTASTQVEGLGYAIPINTAIKSVSDLVEYGYVKGRPAFGITVVEVATPMDAMMYRVNYLGLYVSTSVNEAAGFMSGDLIVSVNGEEIGDYSSLSSAISKLSIGDTAQVEVMRGSQKMTLSVPVIESVPTLTTNPN